MFYDTAKDDHGLKFNPFKALVVPRPIGWIGSISKSGVRNLAPYSFFNAVSDTPPMVFFSSAGNKDSLANILETGEFTCSMSSRALVDAMNLSSAAVAPDVGGVAHAALTLGTAVTVGATVTIGTAVGDEVGSAAAVRARVGRADQYPAPVPSKTSRLPSSVTLRVTEPFELSMELLEYLLALARS